MHTISKNRNFMKSTHRNIDIISDKENGLPYPALFKPSSSNDIIKLPLALKDLIITKSIIQCIEDRASHRSFSTEGISVNELSYLLWSTQGLKKIIAENIGSFRNVPSGGGKHAFETYLIVMNIDLLKNGIYHYLPKTNEIEYLRCVDNIQDTISKSTLNQTYIGNSAVVFIWTCIPYRSEWKYNIAAHKVLLLDAGHICQNLYLACESIGLGTCAIAAYDQEMIDKLISVDGNDEFTVYLAPVGRVK